MKIETTIVKRPINGCTQTWWLVTADGIEIGLVTKFHDKHSLCPYSLQSGVGEGARHLGHHWGTRKQAVEQVVQFFYSRIS